MEKRHSSRIHLKLNKLISIWIVLSFLIVSNFNCRNKPETIKASNFLDQINQDTFDYSTLIGKDFLMDEQHSYLGFKIKYFGISPVRGRFENFDGSLFYDPARPEHTSFTVVIDISSIDTGNDRRDKDLISEESWLNSAAYSFALFQSKFVQINPDSSWTVDGVLSLKGIENPIVLNVKKPDKLSRDWAKNEQVSFEASASLNRKDFGIEGGDFWDTLMEDGLTQLSDNVEIVLEIHCRRADYQERYDDLEPDNPRYEVLSLFNNNQMNPGFKKIDSLFKTGHLSEGALSTIGNTLLEWQMYDPAIKVLNLKQNNFGSSNSTYNQLAIASLYQDSIKNSKAYFENAYQQDSSISKSREYLRLIEKLMNK